MLYSRSLRPVSEFGAYVGKKFAKTNMTKPSAERLAVKLCCMSRIPRQSIHSDLLKGAFVQILRIK